MSRYFSARQKRSLLIQAGFKCQICGTPLSWHNCHADHVYPYSKGGLTRPVNGQALCPDCNLQKGNAVNKNLPWQDDNKKKYIETYDLKPIYILVAGTGSGKTAASVDASMYAYMREAESNPIILCVTPWRSTKLGFKKAFTKQGIRCVTNNNHAADPSLDAIICTYGSAQGMLQLAKESGRPVILILDEFHHLKDDNIWAEPYRDMEIGEGMDVVRAILLSGTPWHEKGELSSSLVKYEETPVVVNGRKKIEARVKHDFYYPYGEAVNEDDDSRNVVTVALFGVDGETIQNEYNEETGEDTGATRILNTESMSKDDQLSPFVDFDSDNIEMYEAATEVLDLAIARLNLVRNLEGTEYVGGIVIVRQKEQAMAVRRYLKGKGKDSVVVTSDDPKAHDLIESFDKDHSQEWIIAIEMISEGVDIPRLKVMADLTNKKTLLHIIQRWGRVLRRVRKPNGSFAINSGAHIYFIKHPMLAHAAEMIEGEVEQYKKEDGPPSPPPPPSENKFKTVDQSCNGVAYIAHGNTEKDEIAQLALWLWETNYHGIRSGRRGHTDCLFTAREMIVSRNTPDAFRDSDEPAEKEQQSYEDQKSAATETLSTWTGRLAHNSFEGDYALTQKYLNKKMNIKAWTVRKVSLDDIRERIELARLAVKNV